MQYNGNTTAGEQSESLAGTPSEITFETIVEETCERLLNRQVKYAIQRIAELEKRLCTLETELDEFLKLKN